MAYQLKIAFWGEEKGQFSVRDIKMACNFTGISLDSIFGEGERFLSCPATQEKNDPDHLYLNDWNT